MPKTRADAMSLNAIMGDRGGARGGNSVVAFAPASAVCVRIYRAASPADRIRHRSLRRRDARRWIAWVSSSRVEPQDDFCSRRMPVLRLAETACVVSRRSPLHRLAQLAAANRPSLRRNPISPAVVVFRPRSLGYHCQAQGAGGEFRSKADRLCRSAQHRFGLRTHARERERLACGDAKSRRASGMAAEEADAIHRRTPCRGRLLVVFGRAGTAEPVPFFPAFKSIR